MQKPIILNPPTTTSGVNGGFSMQQLNDMVLSVVTWRKGTARPDDIQDGEKWHKVDADGNTIGFFEWRTQDGAGDGKNILEYWASVTAAAGKVPLAILDPDTGEVVFDDSWKMGGGGGMPIGTSIAVYCTSTYTPFGAVPQNGASYSETQFPNVVQYIEDGYIPWKTPTDYEAEVTAHGKCACFAWDSTARTFRVPLMPDGTVIQQAMSDSELGKGYDAGLPNIEASWDYDYPGAARGTSGAARIDVGNNRFVGGTPYTSGNSLVNFDASLSNPIYGNSETVQPSAIALRHFVVVATETDQQSVMDWSAWASALGGKANTDLSNFAMTGASAIQYKCIYGTGQAPVGDPYAIEDDALGSSGIVTISSRYVLDNPFGNVPTICLAEVYDGNKWGATGFWNNDNLGRGVQAWGVESEGIVVQTGTSNVLSLSRGSMNPLNFTSGAEPTSLQCRVHIWKVGV